MDAAWRCSAIILHEGKVLDGRNRHRACAEIGVEPITKPWDQRGDALTYVISKNLHRRHLNESQRAMVAAKIATMRPADTLKRGSSGPVPPIGGTDQPKAAAMLNVGERSVQRAAIVRDKAVPELQKAVEAGEVSLWSASEVAKQPEEKQREIVMRGEKAVAALQAEWPLPWKEASAEAINAVSFASSYHSEWFWSGVGSR